MLDLCPFINRVLQVTDITPWYANIVNFMVARYVPPGENKKKLVYESRRHMWDDPYLYRVCADGLLRRCVLLTVLKSELKPSTPASFHNLLKSKLIVRELAVRYLHDPRCIERSGEFKQEGLKSNLVIIKSTMGVRILSRIE